MIITCTLAMIGLWLTVGAGAPRLRYAHSSHPSAKLADMGTLRCRSVGRVRRPLRAARQRAMSYIDGPTTTPIIVIALDPGITTGYAEGIIIDGKLHAVTGQAKWVHKDLWLHLFDIKPKYVISEKFLFRMVNPKTHKTQRGAELYSRELIGVGNLYCQLHDATFVLQNVMKDSPTTFFNNRQLKKDGFYKTGHDHANDAARHLLYWYQFGSGFQYNKHGYTTASQERR